MNNQTLLPIIGLTGSIGSGKSMVADEFTKYKVYIIDADKLSREVTSHPQAPCLIKIAESFGNEVLNENGTLNRRELRNIIFSSPKKKKLLENILHPEIRSLFFSTAEHISKIEFESRNTSGKIEIYFILYVVPLLFESGGKFKEMQKVILVTADKEKCIERIMCRDALPREEAVSIYNSQMPQEEKMLLSDYLIDNNRTKEETFSQVKTVYEVLLTETTFLFP
jgi:dephospho-CoA kinase